MVHQSAGVEPNRAIRSPRRLDKTSSTRTAAGHSLCGARSGRCSFSTGRRAADGVRGWVGSWPIRSRVAPVCSVPSRNPISYSDLTPPRTPFFRTTRRWIALNIPFIVNTWSAPASAEFRQGFRPSDSPRQRDLFSKLQIDGFQTTQRYRCYMVVPSCARRKRTRIQNYFRLPT